MWYLKKADVNYLLHTIKKAGAKLIAAAVLRPLESRDTNGLLLKNDPRDHSSQDRGKLKGLKSKIKTRLQIQLPILSPFIFRDSVG